MDSFFIKNRKKLKVAVCVEQGDGAGLVFLMHGLGGFKEQPHISMMADVFARNGFTVVRFDATNSLGASDGSYQHATVTNYLADLEDVIAWAKTQAWYEEPFTLAAHNMGGMCIALYAARYPSLVKALAPVATIVNGPLSLQALKTKEASTMDAWKASGWLLR